MPTLLVGVSVPSWAAVVLGSRRLCRVFRRGVLLEGGGRNYLLSSNGNRLLSPSLLPQHGTPEITAPYLFTQSAALCIILSRQLATIYPK